MARHFSSGTLPPSDPMEFSVPSNASFKENETVDTQGLMEELAGRGEADDDTEMLGRARTASLKFMLMHIMADMNTQMPGCFLGDEEEDPIRSFTAGRDPKEIVPGSQPDVNMAESGGPDHLDCECGVNVSIFPNVSPCFSWSRIL